MSIINMLKSDVWSEADIVSAGRTAINAQVSMERQQELQTIMLGHIAQMRTATAEEMAEIALVQQVTEAQVIANAAARADMALLNEVLAYEQALTRLTQPVVTEPATVDVTDMDGNVTQIANPAIAQDAEERLLAETIIGGISAEGQALFDLRNPPVVEEEEIVPAI